MAKAKDQGRPKAARIAPPGSPLTLTVRVLPFGTVQTSATYPAPPVEEGAKEEVRIVRGDTVRTRTICQPKPTIER